MHAASQALWSILCDGRPLTPVFYLHLCAVTVSDIPASARCCRALHPYIEVEEHVVMPCMLELHVSVSDKDGAPCRGLLAVFSP